MVALSSYELPSMDASSSLADFLHGIHMRKKHDYLRSLAHYNQQITTATLCIPDIDCIPMILYYYDRKTTQNLSRKTNDPFMARKSRNFCVTCCGDATSGTDNDTDTALTLHWHRTDITLTAHFFINVFECNIYNILYSNIFIQKEKQDKSEIIFSNGFNFYVSKYI